MSPILLHDNVQPHIVQPMLQKLNKLGHEILHFLPYSSDLLPTDYHFSTSFCFHNQQEAEDAFQVFTESRSIDVCAIGINKLISCWLKCVDCNVCYFNKDVLLLSYNDLKFTIQNCNYVCTNLIQTNIQHE